MFDMDLASYGDNNCFISEEEILTYNDVDKVCLAIEKVLPKKKQLILIMARVNIETVVGYLSFLRANHTVIMIDTSMSKEFSSNIINTYEPNLIWEEKEDSNAYMTSYCNYGLRVHSTAMLNLHDELALMLSTSGTTGSPKMVKLTKGSLYANCKSIIQYLDINSNHKVITNLPFYYSYGLSVLNTHLAQGASIIVTEHSMFSKEFWELFKKEQVTTLNGVPYHYEMLKRVGMMKMELPSLKYMTQAGGKLNQKLVKEYTQWAYEHKVDFFVMYGQTEATARISYLPKERTMEKISSIGIPIADGRLFIQDVNSGKLIDDVEKDGELIYEGNNVMMGYATNLEDLVKGDELNGKLATGDIAQKDKDGFFYITGRLKRFIKMQGNRIGLDEVEHYLKSKSYDVLCTGMDNKLMIGVRQEDKAKEILKVVTKAFNLHHSVVKVQYIQKFPVSKTGKIQYEELIKVFT